VASRLPALPRPDYRNALERSANGVVARPRLRFPKSVSVPDYIAPIHRRWSLPLQARRTRSSGQYWLVSERPWRECRGHEMPSSHRIERSRNRDVGLMGLLLAGPI
jgi:hypothetical protein